VHQHAGAPQVIGGRPSRGKPVVSVRVRVRVGVGGRPSRGEPVVRVRVRVRGRVRVRVRVRVTAGSPSM